MEKECKYCKKEITGRKLFCDIECYKLFNKKNHSLNCKCTLCKQEATCLLDRKPYCLEHFKEQSEIFHSNWRKYCKIKNKREVKA